MARTHFCGLSSGSTWIDLLNISAPTGFSYDASIVRGTQPRSLKYVATSGASNQAQLAVSAVGGFWFRIYVRITVLPATARVLIGESGADQILLNPSGTLSYFNNVTLRGTSSTALSDSSRWYCIEINGAGSGTGTYLRIDQVDEITSVTLGACPRLIGAGDTVAATYTAYFQDFARDGANWCGAGAVPLSLAISDNNRGAWTGGAGGTTNLWDATNNTPPTGTASETDATQIESASGSGTDSCDLNFATYTSLGIGSGDTVNAVQMIIAHGEDVATGTKTGSMKIVSNPTQSVADTFTFGADVGALGTFPTNWTIQRGAIQTAPTLSGVGTSPVLRVTKTDTGTRVASVCFIGMYVDYTPAAGGAVFNVSCSGGLTPAGVLGKQTNKTPSGAITSIIGTALKSATKNLAGAISSIIGVILKRPNKLTSGSATPVGVLTKSKTYVQNVSGVITSISGALSKQTAKAPTGASSSSGTLTRRTNKSVVGSSSPGGSLLKLVGKILAGGITPGGILSLSKQFVRSVVGAITPTGGVAKQTNKTTAGSTASTGALDRVSRKNVAGTVSISGSISKRASKVSSGTVSSAGSLLRQAQKFVTGLVASSGTLSRNPRKAPTGAVASAGAVAKETRKTLTAGVTPSGALTRLLARIVSLAGALTPSGTLSKRTAKLVSGDVAPTGIATKRVNKFSSAAASSLGVLAKSPRKNVSGSVTPSGTVTKVLAHAVSMVAAVASSGILGKRTNITVSGTATSDGTLTKTVWLSKGGIVASSGALNRLSRLVAAGMLSSVGGLSKVVGKLFSRFVSIVGQLLHVGGTSGEPSAMTAVYRFVPELYAAVDMRAELSAPRIITPELAAPLSIEAD